MLRRVFTSRHLNELWKSGRFALSLVNKTQAIGGSLRDFPRQPSHLFRTGSSLKRENLDLDKWKSVLRSQSVAAEREDAEDEGARDDVDDDVPEGSNNLGAAREMVAMWQLAGKMVPKEISEEQLQIVADLTTKSARKKYLKYLALKEGYKRANKERRQQKKAAREAELEQKQNENPDGDSEEYPNTFVPRFWNRNLDRLLGWRTAQAMLFDQPLVFDMSYEANMSRRELENTVTQLLEVEGCNRRAKEPFHLHFCNLQPDGAYMKELLKRYGADAWDRLLITDTERHAVDVFPRQSLIYLTADSPNVLRAFDRSKVYIVGALVDRSILSGLSLANAKRLKLATARLPLDEFLHWEVGAKNLTLDQMMRIMICLKETGKWEEALQFVPKRKHVGFHQGTTHHGAGQNGDRLPKSQTTNRNGKQSGFKFQGELKGMKQLVGPSRVRASLKSSVEQRRESRKKSWWDD